MTPEHHRAPGAIGDATSPDVQNEAVFALATILLLAASRIALRSRRAVLERFTNPEPGCWLLWRHESVLAAGISAVGNTLESVDRSDPESAHGAELGSGVNGRRLGLSQLAW